MLRKSLVSLTLAGFMSAGATTAFGEIHVVTIYDNHFMPPLVYANPGDTIRFLNDDTVARTALAKDESWSTDSLAPSGSFDVQVASGMDLTFESADTTTYEDGVTANPEGAVTFDPAPVD